MRETNNLFERKLIGLVYIFFIFSVILIPAAQADILFEDNFNTPGDDINRDNWTTPEGNAAFFGRTAIRNPHIPSGITEGLPATIKVEEGAAKLRLDTYNPTDPKTTKTSFWGSEMDTIQKWAPSADSGISFAARVRSPGIPKGVVTSIFGYNLINAATTNRDEIDFEFLSNHYNYNSAEPKILINYFRNENTSSPGQPELLPVNVDFNEFNTFRMDWFEDKIQWYINDNLLAGKNVTVPTALSLNLNIWAPNSSFADAFNLNLNPAQNISANQPYFYEVDWVRVSTVTPEPVSATLFLIGSAVLGLTGLKKRKK